MVDGCTFTPGRVIVLSVDVDDCGVGLVWLLVVVVVVVVVVVDNPDVTRD